MFGCYRKGDANDPDTYTAAIAAVFSEYEPEVVRRATDPRTGIARVSKFLPNPAEVSAACDAIVASMKLEVRMAAMGWQWCGLKQVRVDDYEKKWESRWEKVEAA